MLSMLNAPIIDFHSDVSGNPAVSIFGVGITYYALIIVAGMILAILLSMYLFKKCGFNADDVLDYAIVLIPSAVLGCRLYFFMFPYEGTTTDWSEFFNFRSGGLAIYGGVIAGYIAVRVVAYFKMHKFERIADIIVVVLLMAQAIGRWGNFVNQEAYGNLVENPNLQWFPYAVHIGNNYYQATFFYESFLNIIGAVIAFLLLTRWKNYKRGFNLAFYFIYYGVVRLIVESFRSDSLYFLNTGIKVSQLVSAILIVIGIVRLVLIYTKTDLKIDIWLAKTFKTRERFERNIVKAQTKADKLREEADKLAEQLPAESKLVVSAKKKADYALLNAANVKKTVQNFYDEYYRHGLDLKTLQIVPKQKITAQENKEGEK